MKKRNQLMVVALGAVLGLSGCDDDDGGSADTDNSGETDAETGGGDACDPVGAQPEQAALFNAPVADDVEVIQKAPAHPGEPGPDNLP